MSLDIVELTCWGSVILVHKPCRPDGVTVMLRILQRLPVMLRVKSRVLTMTVVIWPLPAAPGSPNNPSSYITAVWS